MFPALGEGFGGAVVPDDGSAWVPGDNLAGTDFSDLTGEETASQVAIAEVRYEAGRRAAVKWYDDTVGAAGRVGGRCRCGPRGRESEREGLRALAAVVGAHGLAPVLESLGRDGA